MGMCDQWWLLLTWLLLMHLSVCSSLRAHWNFSSATRLACVVDISWMVLERERVSSNDILSGLSARPPDLATATAAQPEVACVRLSIVPFLYSKRTAVTRSLVSLIEKRTFCGHFEHTSRGTTLHMCMHMCMSYM